MSGRPSPDPARNISAALALRPDAIIVNLPTNDIAARYTLGEAEENLRLIAAEAAAAGVPIWLTTAQPRNLDAAARDNLQSLTRWVQTTFNDRSLDFWSGLGLPDGTIDPSFSAGDGIHLNNAGHQKLYNRVATSNVLSSVCAGSPAISQLSSAAMFDRSITWSTTGAASSQVEYGTTAGYGISTAETDLDHRVTQHRVVLRDLLACTTYHYRVHSRASALRDQLSGDDSFTTPCQG